MQRERGIAYCGLACCLCQDPPDCVGCKQGGCKDKENCKNYVCCTTKNLDGCYSCQQFACQDSILHKVRIQAFSLFIKKYGEEKLLDCLERNELQGMVYHYPGGHVGDYDQYDTVEDIIHVILHGKEKH